MAANRQVITIDSVLGGHAAYANFAEPNQYRDSYGIDPTKAEDFQSFSGYLSPSGVTSPTSASEITDTPLWIVPQPKTDLTYIYGYSGSVYSFNGTSISPVTNITNSRGNGAAYNDNYVYLISNTTVARYGPLDGAASLTADYWVTTLGKTALTDTTYPESGTGTMLLPNHVSLRHNDGALYFADVVGNQGVLHKIKTTKTTVEGDTDAGSTFNAIDFPYGMYVTALCSLGDKIVVALYEGSGDDTAKQGKAKIAIWDPTNPTTYDSITSEEFPDAAITAMVNSNGVVYTFSTNLLNANNTAGVRVMRLVSSNSFEQIAYIGQTVPVLPGAVDGNLNQIVFGGKNVNASGGVVWSVGSAESPLNNAIYCPIKSTSGSSLRPVTALKFSQQFNLATAGSSPVLGWGNGTAGTAVNSINTLGQTNDSGTLSWVSQTYRIGRKFKITKIVFPMDSETPSATTRVIQPFIKTDNQSYTGNQYTLTPINSDTHIDGTVRQIRRSDQNGKEITGEHSFAVRLDWSGTQAPQYAMALPITIEYELLED